MASAQEVIDRARQLVNDVASEFVSGVRWGDSEMLQWLTDGQRDIVKLKPEANAITDWFEVTGNHSRQRLDPAIAHRLIRVEANGTGGVVDAPAVVLIGESAGFSAVSQEGDPFTLETGPLPAGSDNRFVLVIFSRFASESLVEGAEVTYGGVPMNFAVYVTTTGIQYGIAACSLNGEVLDDDVLSIAMPVNGVGIYGQVLVFDNVNPEDEELDGVVTTSAASVGSLAMPSFDVGTVGDGAFTFAVGAFSSTPESLAIEDEGYLNTDGFAFSSYAARAAFANTVEGSQNLEWLYNGTASRLYGLALSLRAI